MFSQRQRDSDEGFLNAYLELRETEIQTEQQLVDIMSECVDAISILLSKGIFVVVEPAPYPLHPEFRKLALALEAETLLEFGGS